MTTPAEDLAGYLTRYPEELAFGTEDPEAVLDRYHTPDLEYCNDGTVLSRDALLAHVRPVRKRATAVRVDVHEAVVTGDRVAARYTLTATMRKGGELATEIYMFGRLAADGRISRIDQLTRIP